MPSERARQGRSLLQARKTIVEQGTQSRNAIKGLLRGCGCTLSAVLWRHPEQLRETLEKLERVPSWMRPQLAVHYSVWLETQRQRALLDKQIQDELTLWPDAEHLQSLRFLDPTHAPTLEPSAKRSMKQTPQTQHGPDLP